MSTDGTDSTDRESDSTTESTVSKEPERDPDNISDNLTVPTNSGLVQGFQWQENENIIGYYDIPYGTFNHPFQSAIAAEKWQNIHEVQEHEKRCPQLENEEYVGDTDCLTLSIFKPLNAENASVLFHIHAENFDSGSGDPSIYGPDYLVTKEIILVLPNYRLGPLGFLCMQNETAPGNMALKDLSLALNWTRDNIKAFGGDPNNIAVSGEGQSGALAGLLALYPMSKENVKKVITESGSLLAYWALDRDPTTTAANFLERLTEINNVSAENLSLENLNMSTILTAAKDIEFRPCVETVDENSFMTTTPYATLSNNKIDISFLIGSTMFAGAHQAIYQTDSSIAKLNEDSTHLLPNDLQFSSSSLKQETGQRVKMQYFGEEIIQLSDQHNLSLCFTDIRYLGPSIRTARRLVAAGATVFFYEFAFAGQLNRVLDSIGNPVGGAVRGDIIGYLFTQDGVPCKEELIAECNIVGNLTEMLTNFLNSGSPSTDAVTWNKLEKVKELEEEWLLIDTDIKMQKGLHPNRLALWTKIYEDHFIERNGSRDISPVAYIIIVFQCLFFLTFCTTVSHIV
ncbi:unnamed protein product [Arctia plantaginis]|uniref:Carboxylesterase type B domain-containing protein n=1 Tax=Arctia plantaginis TaxID=874455 RepID=A0A8S1AX20_ARCPL|nr:unnamed protein product [Arctia plantaginis]